MPSRRVQVQGRLYSPTHTKSNIDFNQLLRTSQLSWIKLSKVFSCDLWVKESHAITSFAVYQLICLVVIEIFFQKFWGIFNLCGKLSCIIHFVVVSLTDAISSFGSNDEKINSSESKEFGALDTNRSRTMMMMNFFFGIFFIFACFWRQLTNIGVFLWFSWVAWSLMWSRIRTRELKLIEFIKIRQGVGNWWSSNASHTIYDDRCWTI